MSSSSAEPDKYHEQVVAFALASVLLSICICGILGTYKMPQFYTAIHVCLIWFSCKGNAVVLGVGIYKQKYRKNTTNCFIMNLAVTDLFFLLTSVPLTSYLGLSRFWIFGEFICKMNIYLAHVRMFSRTNNNNMDTFQVFLQATCYTLAAMSIDRYLHMVHVVWYRKYRTPKHTLIICLSIWISKHKFSFVIRSKPCCHFFFARFIFIHFSL